MREPSAISAGQASISVLINGEPRRVPAGLSLDQLVTFLALDPKKVAIEWNREVINRTRWPAVPVGDGDSLEIVQFVGGG